MKEARGRTRREPLIIEAFCRALSTAIGEAVSVIRHEDTVHGSWDAVIQRAGRHWALDLRRMNQVENEMHESSLWATLRGVVEEGMNQAFPGMWGDINFRGGEIVELRSRGAMPKAADLVEDVFDALRQPHRRIRQRRSVGSRTGLSLTTRMAKGPGGFRVRHVAPGGHLDQLARDLASAIDSKSLQLKSGQQAGMQTILVLECDNLAIVSAADIHDAFTTAARGRSLDAIDDAWFVREVGQRFEVHPLRRGGHTLSSDDFAEWGRRHALLVLGGDVHP